MQFEMARLSLVQRPQVDAFERRSPDGSLFSREGWLRDIFGRHLQFQHQGAIFHYNPILNHSAGRAIVGRIGRQITVAENEPPDGGLAPVERDTWRAAILFIDPTHHGDGQKVAFEHLPNVGRPIPILESLAAQVSGPDEPYLLEANAIVPSETFWNFVNENQGSVTSIEFEFVAPNMFGEADDYDREMRDMHQRENAQRAKLRIESKDGLNLNTGRVKKAADYAIKGTRSIKAKTKSGRRYNTKDKAQKISITNKEIATLDQKSLLSTLVNRIFRI